MNFKKSLLAVLSAPLMLATAPSMAESTYGYNAAGTGPVTATARLNITVNVPLLILLRVGSATGTGDTLTFNGAFAAGIPGGPAALIAGNNQAATWDGTAPVFTAVSTPASVAAYSWTNSSGGGKVTCAVTTAFPAASGLTAASISVASTVVAGGGLAHPGTDTSCGGTTNYARNTVVQSTWTYSLPAASLNAVTPGANSELITYTATTL